MGYVKTIRLNLDVGVSLKADPITNILCTLESLRVNAYRVFTMILRDRQWCSKKHKGLRNPIITSLAYLFLCISQLLILK